MRDAWRDGSITFEGKHYQVDGAIVAPRPLQDGVIPLWIAGGGEKLTLRIAAKYAQYTNFTSELEGFAHKSQYSLTTVVISERISTPSSGRRTSMPSSGRPRPTSRNGSAGFDRGPARCPVRPPPTRC